MSGNANKINHYPLRLDNTSPLERSRLNVFLLCLSCYIPHSNIDIMNLKKVINCVSLQNSILLFNIQYFSSNYYSKYIQMIVLSVVSVVETEQKISIEFSQIELIRLQI